MRCEIEKIRKKMSERNRQMCACRATFCFAYHVVPERGVFFFLTIKKNYMPHRKEKERRRKKKVVLVECVQLDEGEVQVE